MTRFDWTPRRRQAAVDVADDHFDDDAIAERVGVSRKTLAEWKLHPAFIAKVDEHRHALHEQVQRKGIADKQNRVDKLNALLADLETIKRERATKYGAGVTGGTTGLVILEPMFVKVYGDVDGRGRFVPTGQSELVEVEKFDAALVREIRATIEQGKKEDVEVDDLDVSEMSDEELDAFVRSKGKRRS